MGAFPLTRLLDKASTIFLALLAAFAIAIPALNLILPAGSAFHVSTYLVALFGKYICYAMLALSIDLIWGCLLYTSPSPRDRTRSRMPSSA